MTKLLTFALFALSLNAHANVKPKGTVVFSLCSDDVSSANRTVLAPESICFGRIVGFGNQVIVTDDLVWNITSVKKTAAGVEMKLETIGSIGDDGRVQRSSGTQPSHATALRIGDDADETKLSLVQSALRKFTATKFHVVRTTM